jgi:hypothetical protein
MKRALKGNLRSWSVRQERRMGRREGVEIGQENQEEQRKSGSHREGWVRKERGEAREGMGAIRRRPVLHC